MNENLEPLERLADMFRKLDGVGKRSAARYAYNILSFTPEEAAEFAEAILAAKTESIDAVSAATSPPARSADTAPLPSGITA